jgi:hypothetical protein
MEQPATHGRAPAHAVVHLVYDKTTGRVVHRHTVYNVEQETYQASRPEEILALALQDEDFILDRVSDRDRANLAVLTVEDVPLQSTVNVRVDTRSKKLVPRPKLRLTADKRELTGDGKDTATLKVEVVDGSGAVVKSHKGGVKVTTTRGKLSAPGGVIQLRQGSGEIRLTSVNETVDRVTVTAIDQRGISERGVVDLEFL